MNKHIQELHEKGFTVLRKCISEDARKDALAAYDYICAERAAEALATSKANGRNSRLVNSHLESEKISSLFLSKSLLDTCDTFFGGRRSAIYTSLFFEEGTKQPLHRDAPVFCTFPENLFLGCWFALEDSRISNGALMGIPASHKIFYDELKKRYEIGVDRLKDLPDIPYSDNVSWNQYQNYVYDSCSKIGLACEPIEVDACDVVVWHPLFVHGGLPHTSDATRKSIVMHVIPEEVDVHGSYLFFSPYKTFAPRRMEFISIGSSERKMKTECVHFGKDA
ncbi:phytanoyl-CoA dioxygenase family protein [Cyanobium sp. ATX 6F1]|uniref:phytanoyl-CoA dioxygenase family protein n=1 Tax=unclassified Cyanobium TaxID=2627006 RepID=UPI0020CED111|nr:phytanoyl-CoA dioxygenase family protein [Cyanobium sp. ATX 6F1]MCP9917468.1 phytanoyl-CoA dioxygenase family protein [Cyanobium sp. ATX 6F1]